MSEEQTKQNVSLEETFEQIETIIKQLERQISSDETVPVTNWNGRRSSRVGY